MRILCQKCNGRGWKFTDVLSGATEPCQCSAPATTEFGGFGGAPGWVLSSSIAVGGKPLVVNHADEPSEMNASARAAMGLLTHKR